MWTYVERTREDPLFPEKIVDHFIHDDEGVWITYNGPYQEDVHPFVCYMNYAGEQRKFMFMVLVDDSPSGVFTKILSPSSSTGTDYTFIEGMEKHERQRLGKKFLSALEHSYLFRNLEKPFPLPIVFNDRALKFYGLDPKTGVPE